jgi:hypothetical protein
MVGLFVSDMTSSRRAADGHQSGGGPDGDGGQPPLLSTSVLFCAAGQSRRYLDKTNLPRSAQIVPVMFVAE